MAGVIVNRGGRPPLLTPDGERLALLRDFGLRGYNKAECARRLDVHRQTFHEFLEREPRARDAYESGLRDRRATLLATVPEPAPRKPKTGDICPTCGGRVGDNENAIVLTPAAIAEAQRTLDAIIDRHLAARGADSAEGNAR